ncbi:MAG: very short patch repair endonuclease, partial [Brevundimonas sp.]|nr:very short patch repair endonuclease [Brevundimonas sp.]
MRRVKGRDTSPELAVGRGRRAGGEGCGRGGPGGGGGAG